MNSLFNGIILSNLALALSASDNINKNLGYPKCLCPKCSGRGWETSGIHPDCPCVPPSASLFCPHLIRAYSEPVQHEISGTWAIPIFDNRITSSFFISASYVVVQIDKKAWFSESQKITDAKTTEEIAKQAIINIVLSASIVAKQVSDIQVAQDKLIVDKQVLSPVETAIADIDIMNKETILILERQKIITEKFNDLSKQIQSLKDQKLITDETFTVLTDEQTTLQNDFSKLQDQITSFSGKYLENDIQMLNAQFDVINSRFNNLTNEIQIDINPKLPAVPVGDIGAVEAIAIA